jgi:hypothetical protein
MLAKGTRAAGVVLALGLTAWVPWQLAHEGTHHPSHPALAGPPLVPPSPAATRTVTVIRHAAPQPAYPQPGSGARLLATQAPQPRPEPSPRPSVVTRTARPSPGPTVTVTATPPAHPHSPHPSPSVTPSPVTDCVLQVINVRVCVKGGTGG